MADESRFSGGSGPDGSATGQHTSLELGSPVNAMNGGTHTGPAEGEMSPTAQALKSDFSGPPAASGPTGTTGPPGPPGPPGNSPVVDRVIQSDVSPRGDAICITSLLS
jgi:hypothetical protein